MEITSIEAFLPYYENIRARTERVIACIPPTQLEWRPQTDAFSFGDLIRHLGAIERYMFAENAQGRPVAIRATGRSSLLDGTGCSPFSAECIPSPWRSWAA